MSAIQNDDAPDPDPARDLLRLAALLHSAGTAAHVLTLTAATAQLAIPGTDLASVTVRGPDGLLSTPISLDPVAAELDNLQYETGEGPCVDAAAGRGGVRALDDDTTWPTFSALATSRGYRSVLATTILGTQPDGVAKGALNLYSTAAGAFDDEDADTALVLAAALSLALADTGATTYADLRRARLPHPIGAAALAERSAQAMAGPRSSPREGAALHEVAGRLNTTLAGLDGVLTAQRSHLLGG
ncbi:GAF domain-containing protein [Actinokineospora bangkokensis]|uniref:ANTAR domain-containing protein n=1 Tax=Actinokineospora bangkokensis TaxID=1193682 RepID=A0A1Q9LN95_9PSEU|nr:GAF domain-containing protein [Actinokineospora bangkokensis]OLR93473.1 hypothetical protein BJP25_14290 [Actinokineospora bangkokensis]